MRRTPCLTTRFAQRSGKQLIVSVGVGVVATLVRLGLLVLAANDGADLADFMLTLGMAVGLSGVVWWCASRIRQDRAQGATDYSALVFLALLGGAGAAWALSNGSEPSEALLTGGRAFATIWLFVSLEAMFVLDEKNQLPLGLKILASPFYPFMWLILRGMDFGAKPVPIDDHAVFDDARIEAELSGFDADSPLRVPSRAEEEFQATAADAARKLGVEFRPA